MTSTCDDEQQQPKTLLPELMMDVLSRLPVLSLLQSKVVCRSWHAISHDPHFLSLHLSRRPHPCLILCSDPNNNLYLVDEDALFLNKLHTPFVVDFDVVGSCNGLLCLSDTYSDVLHVHNPLTGGSLTLPQGGRYSNSQMVVHGFGFDPRTGVYKVVRVVYYALRRMGILRGCRFTPDKSEVQILTLGGSEANWRSCGKAPCNLVQCASQVLVKGRLHWGCWRFRSDCMIMSLDLEDEEFKEVPRPECGPWDISRYHLIEMRGCLSAAVYCNKELEIWVMKEYDVKESWVKEMKIGSYVPKVLRETDQYIKTLNNGKVLCLLESGEILIEYARRALVCYDPKEASFRELVLKDLPTTFDTVVHVGSFNWVHTPIHL